MSWKFWEKKSLELKSNNPNAQNESFVQYLQDNDNWDLSFAMLIEYSQRCAPFGNAVAIIAEALSGIPLKVWDKKDKVFIDDHESMELLTYPNSDQSYSDWVVQFGGMYLITGNPYVNPLGSYRRAPTALEILSPQYGDPQPDSTGDLGRVIYQDEFGSRTYIASYEKGRSRLRSGTDNEVWPVFAFNPNRGSRKFYGTPTAKPLYYEIEQYINAGIHNKTLLKRGARPGGLFTAKTEHPLTDEQIDRFQKQIDTYYVGSNNAGRPLFGENVDYKESIVSNRDMDYKSIVENTSDSIYKQFKIPLPLVSNKASTFSNYETAQVSLYDRAVLPLADFLFRQLTMAIMYRYEDDWKRYEFTYDESDISALQMRRNESIKVEKEIGVSTVNELRTLLGKDEIEGGDVILRPASDVPALDGYDDIPDQLDDMDEDEKRKALSNVTDINGNPKFTSEQIEKLVSL